MASFPDITEGLIRQYATDKSFERGSEYYEWGSVLSVTLRGSRLFAEVQGSDCDPYQVCVPLDAGDLTSTECTCPYEWEGVCKHIVAALLTCIRDPDLVNERPSIESLIAPLSSDQLKALLVSLVERAPALAEVIDEHCSSLRHPQKTRT